MQSVILWWGSVLILGIGFLPLTSYMFQKSDDGGWLFSKTIGLFLSGWILWTFNVLHVLEFRQRNILIVVFVLASANYGIFFWQRTRKKTKKRPAFIHWKLILMEEILFTALFALAVYIVGFRPEAYGTEKFMDYGFMTAMSRSFYMPFEDPWYAGKAVNYYYGGQYMAAFLMKMTGDTPGVSYNLMRATVTAFSFALPFSLTYTLMRDKMGENARSPWLAGILGGCAVAFCGNFHYVIYGIIYPLLGLGGKDYSYWFPDSTRYIGYDPDLPDKTIHEFPAYSSVLGDLHAHYVNLIFVLTVVAIVYAWAQKEKSGKISLRTFLRPEILLIGIFTGVFRWTNFWDFPIYYVVCGSILFFVNLRTYKGHFTRWLIVMAGEAVEILVIGYVASLPFTATFYQISSEIRLTHSHTLWYQLLVLWGLPAAVLVFFVIQLILEYRNRKKLLQPSAEPDPKASRESLSQSSPKTGSENKTEMALPDLAVLLFGLCAAGLVFLPEVIYVKDIYGSEHYRANTMFKLTYQAFILFGIMMAYVTIRALAGAARKKTKSLAAGAGGQKETGIFVRKPGDAVSRVFGCIFLAAILLTSGYMGKAVSSWFGNIFVPPNRINTDASVFVSEDFQSDFGGIEWLNEHVHDMSVILEAPGDSYSDYERVSVATGLPTVCGWYVHEWLWRGGHEEEDQRLADIQTIYTSTDAETVKELIRKYKIRYIYIGNLEREKYPDIQDGLLQSIGETVYSDGVSTYILEVQQDKES